MKAIISAPDNGRGPGSAGRTGQQRPPPSERIRMLRPGGWLRFESGGLNGEQTLKNLETAVSLLQKALDGLNNIAGLLDDAVAAVHQGCAREGPEEVAALVALRLDQIDEIVRQCRFHGRGLLDGQSGVCGLGLGVAFIRGGANTRASPAEGFPVAMEVVPTRSHMIGGVRIDDDWVRAEEEIFLAEGEQFFRYRIGPRETVSSLLQGLREEAREAGLEVQIGITSQGHLAVRHNQFGSQYKFKGCSFRTPLLSHRPGKVEWSRKGRDISGTIAGEPAFGIGRMLVGYLDNEHTSELALLWQGGERRGRCYVVQNALSFQDGAGGEQDTVRLALPSLVTAQLGRWMETASGYDSLAEVRFGTWQETRDALHLMMAVSFEIDEWRERVEEWIKRYQNRALAFLRKGQGLVEFKPPDERVSAEQARRMAVQLKALIQGGWQPPGLGTP